MQTPRIEIVHRPTKTVEPYTAAELPPPPPPEPPIDTIWNGNVGDFGIPKPWVCHVRYANASQSYAVAFDTEAEAMAELERVRDAFGGVMTCDRAADITSPGCEPSEAFVIDYEGWLDEMDLEPRYRTGGGTITLRKLGPDNLGTDRGSSESSIRGRYGSDVDAWLDSRPELGDRFISAACIDVGTAAGLPDVVIVRVR